MSFNGKPASWNLAAQICMIEIFHGNPMLCLPSASIAAIRKKLDFMISIGMSGGNAEYSNMDFSRFWREIAWITHRAAENAGIALFQNRPVELATHICKKQADYGHDNISRFGRIGLLVRVHDKIARLENLTSKGVEPQNESLIDNYIDVIGYAAIGMMVERGWFSLSLDREALEAVASQGV